MKQGVEKSSPDPHSNSENKNPQNSKKSNPENNDSQKKAIKKVSLPHAVFTDKDLQAILESGQPLERIFNGSNPWLTRAMKSISSSTDYLGIFSDSEDGFDIHEGESLSSIYDKTKAKPTECCKLLNRGQYKASAASFFEIKLEDASYRAKMKLVARSENAGIKNIIEGKSTDLEKIDESRCYQLLDGIVGSIIGMPEFLKFKPALIRSTKNVSAKSIIMKMTKSELVNLLKIFYNNYGSGLVTENVYGDIANANATDLNGNKDNTKVLRIEESINAQTTENTKGNGSFLYDKKNHNNNQFGLEKSDVIHKTGLIGTKSHDYMSKQFFMALCGQESEVELWPIFDIFSLVFQTCELITKHLCERYNYLLSVQEAINFKLNDIFKPNKAGIFIKNSNGLISRVDDKIKNAFDEITRTRDSIRDIIQNLKNSPFDLFKEDFKNSILEVAKIIDNNAGYLKSLEKVTLVEEKHSENMLLKTNTNGNLTLTSTVDRHHVDIDHISKNDKYLVILNSFPQVYKDISVNIKLSLMLTKNGIIGSSITQDMQADMKLKAEIGSQSQILANLNAFKIIPNSDKIPADQIFDYRLSQIEIDLGNNSFEKLAAFYKADWGRFRELIRNNNLDNDFSCLGLNDFASNAEFIPAKLLDKIRGVKLDLSPKFDNNCLEMVGHINAMKDFMEIENLEWKFSVQKKSINDKLDGIVRMLRKIHHDCGLLSSGDKELRLRMLNNLDAKLEFIQTNLIEINETAKDLNLSHKEGIALIAKKINSNIFVIKNIRDQAMLDLESIARCLRDITQYSQPQNSSISLNKTVEYNLAELASKYNPIAELFQKKFDTLVNKLNFQKDSLFNNNIALFGNNSHHNSGESSKEIHDHAVDDSTARALP